MTREQQKAVAAKMRSEGKTLDEIGKAVGVHRNTVGMWFNPSRYQNYRQYQREWKRKEYHAKPEVAQRQREQFLSLNATLEGRCKIALRNALNRSRQDGGLPCTATVQELAETFTGYCDCCGKHESEFKKRLAMDHDHETGEFRGWLCQPCNTALGKLGDNPQELWRAFAYLAPSHAEIALQAFVQQ